MNADTAVPGLQDSIYILVTGANSGLGFSICCRLIDEFLQRKQGGGSEDGNGDGSKGRRRPQHLTIIFTTRSTKKGDETLTRLKEHLYHYISGPNSNSSTTSPNITFHPETVDLSNLLSVRFLSRRLQRTRSIPKLDAVILNAGLGGWFGIDWPRAVWEVGTDLVHAVSWPSYKLASVGLITGSQVGGRRCQGRGQLEGEPRLGAVFCSNVFGHYMLAHNLVPLLKEKEKKATKSSDWDGPGRIIWVSSLEATTRLFDVNDIQGIRSKTPYESSKALTDILALTSNLPETAPWVESFLSTDTTEDNNNNNNNKNNHNVDDEGIHRGTQNNPNIYLSHPGICGTGILPLPSSLFYAMLCIFWIARFLGSPWHTLSTYLGACAPVWLALSPQQDLDEAESPYIQNGGGGGRAKWGSSCSWTGRACRPVCTEIDGWGYGGVVGGPVTEDDCYRRRKRGAKDLSVEEKGEFVELGRLCWRRMEELRVQWEGLLDIVDDA